MIMLNTCWSAHICVTASSSPLLCLSSPISCCNFQQTVTDTNPLSQHPSSAVQTQTNSHDHVDFGKKQFSQDYYCFRWTSSAPCPPCSRPPPGDWGCAAPTVAPPRPRSGGGTMMGSQCAMLVVSIINCTESTDLWPWERMEFKQEKGNPSLRANQKKTSKLKVNEN